MADETGAWLIILTQKGFSVLTHGSELLGMESNLRTEPEGSTCLSQYLHVEPREACACEIVAR